MADGAGPLSAAEVIRLAAWISAAAPVGGFACSHGLETAIAEGTIRDEAELRAWVECVLSNGAGWSDTVIAAHAVRTSRAGEPLEELADLARALAPSAERRMETDALGTAFAAMAREGWGVAVGPAPYPVAFGAAIGLTLGLMLHGMATMIVSAGQRLVPLGQTAAQRVLAGLVPRAAALGAEAAEAPIAAVGGAAFAADIAAMRHETLQPRLFRT